MFGSTSGKRVPPINSKVAIFGGLPKGLESKLDEMTVVQQRKVLLNVNKVADSCFRECCTDFSLTKYLGSGEEQCVSRCVDKYLALKATAGGALADHLVDDPQARVRR